MTVAHNSSCANSVSLLVNVRGSVRGQGENEVDQQRNKHTKAQKEMELPGFWCERRVNHAEIEQKFLNVRA